MGNDLAIQSRHLSTENQNFQKSPSELGAQVLLLSVGGGYVLLLNTLQNT